MAKPVAVLIIDDSEDDRMFYRRTLKKAEGTDYAVSEASNGEDGIRQLLPDPPACVLLDYSLPGHNGIEILKRIRSRLSFIPVVMLTGQGNEAVAVSAMQEGAQNYVSKSNITPESLQRAIAVAIEHCALHKRIDEQRSSLEVFTRALAHDLKEPVRTIRSFLGILKAHETFSEKGKIHFNYVENAARRMHALIDTVFLYTQLDNTEKQISLEICDANAAFADTLENLGELIRERGAVVTADRLLKVHAHPMQLIQVFQNLIANAIYHTEITPEIHVSAVEKNEFWQFSVRDNGPGIHSEHCKTIFEPFRRFSHHAKGMGMGLAICRKVIESHGGEIHCESGMGKGAVFLFTLPKAASPGVPVPASLPDRRQAQQGTDPALASILMVEDNEADIELARIMLIEEPGLQCTLLVARDGNEAIAAMNAEREKSRAVDLVLLDINMPGMNGFELLEHIRQEEHMRDIPVIMCTTSDYSKDRENAQRLGAKGYLTKPAVLDGLKSIVENIPTLRLCPQENGYALLRAT